MMSILSKVIFFYSAINNMTNLVISVYANYTLTKCKNEFSVFYIFSSIKMFTYLIKFHKKYLLCYFLNFPSEFFS